MEISTIQAVTTSDQLQRREFEENESTLLVPTEDGEKSVSLVRILPDCTISTENLDKPGIEVWFIMIGEVPGYKITNINPDIEIISHHNFTGIVGFLYNKIHWIPVLSNYNIRLCGTNIPELKVSIGDKDIWDKRLTHAMSKL